jgi:hypothetical protein
VCPNHGKASPGGFWSLPERSGVSLSGQRKPKTGAFFRRTLDPDAPAVGFDDAFGNRQAQPGAAGLAAARFFPPGKTVRIRVETSSGAVPSPLSCTRTVTALPSREAQILSSRRKCVCRRAWPNQCGQHAPNALRILLTGSTPVSALPSSRTPCVRPSCEKDSSVSEITSESEPDRS